METFNMDQQYIDKARQFLARLDRIPIWPYPKKVMITVGIGFFFAFYDILSIGLALPSIRHLYQASLHAVTWAITSSLIGYIIGSLIDSRISDKWGRRLSLCLSIGTFSIGSILTAVSMNLGWVIGSRLISGMGLGAEIASLIAYLEELSPAGVRGKATSTAVAYGMVGFAVVPFIALYLIPAFDWGWRVLFLLGGLGGLVILVMRRNIPHSPRWLMIHYQPLEEIENIINKAETLAIKKINHELPEPAPIEAYPFLADTSIISAFKAPFTSRMIFFGILWFFYYVGNYAWLSLATTLFFEHGFALAKSIAFVAISSLGFIFGSLLVPILSDRMERKWLAAAIALVWSIALLVVGWFPLMWVIIVAGFIATTTIAMIIPTLYIYTGENFPTRVRATCLSFTDGFGHLGGAFCGQIIFFIASYFKIPYLHYAMSFTAMAVTGLITFILLLFGIRMTQRSLAELSKPMDNRSA